MKPKLNYKQLKTVLEGLGYKPQDVTLDINGQDLESVIFRHKDSDLYILLPRMKATKIVEPMYIHRVKGVLEDVGFWDSLVKQTKTENKDEAIEVLQKLARIKATSQKNGEVQKNDPLIRAVGYKI